MLKDTLIIFILFIYLILFFFWLIWFHKSLKNKINKKKIYFFNIIGFVMTTYVISFLVLRVLS